MPDEQLKLRILLTNACSRRCHYCLNDFQEVPTWFSDGDMIPIDACMHVVDQYLKFCRARGIKSEIYLSGGEPTVHPKFIEIVRDISRQEPSKFVLCTNGNGPNVFQGYDLFLFHEIHISIHEASLGPLQPYVHLLTLASFKKNRSNPRARLTKIVFSSVFNEYAGDHSSEFGRDGLDEAMLDNIERSSHAYEFQNAKEAAGIEEIVFRTRANFFRRDDKDYMARYRKIVEQRPWLLSKSLFSFEASTARRGFCTDCPKLCMPLRAMWVFPNCTMYPCPRDRKLAWELIPDSDLSNYFFTALHGRAVAYRSMAK